MTFAVKVMALALALYHVTLLICLSTSRLRTTTSCVFLAAETDQRHDGMEIRYFLNTSKDDYDLLSSDNIDTAIGTSPAETRNETVRTSEREDDELYYVPTYLIVLLSFLYGLIALVAVVGNAVVLAAIAHSRSMHTLLTYLLI